MADRRPTESDVLVALRRLTKDGSWVGAGQVAREIVGHYVPGHYVGRFVLTRLWKRGLVERRQRWTNPFEYRWVDVAEDIR